MTSEPTLVEDPVGGGDGHRAQPRRLRDLWAIDQNEHIVRFARSPRGRFALVSLFAAAAHLGEVHLLPVIVAAAFAYLPKWRNLIVLAAALAALALNSGARVSHGAIATILLQEGIQPSSHALGIAALATYLLWASATLALVRRDRTLFIARRPVATLLGTAALLGVVAASPLVEGLARAALWSFLIVFAAFFWFFSYALVDQRSRSPAALPFQVGILHPFWGSSATPFGKGASFLRKHLARDDAELAVTQLISLKLMVWALLLMLSSSLLVELLEVRIGIPKPELAYAAHLRGQPLPPLTSWSSLTWATFSATLSLAIWGHQIIAVARLAGFRLPRNTWRPLESRTLAEFWNRYYYYFKELLVEFFFMPTFLRVFRRHPHLRVFFATFMAAGVGNAIYHFLRDIELIAIVGPRQAFESFSSYLLYCFVLAVGIGISQARTNAGRMLPTTFPGTLWSATCVWSFFVCLHVFNDQSPTLSLQDRVSFLASLFGFG